MKSATCVSLLALLTIGLAFSKTTTRNIAEGKWHGQWEQTPVTLQLIVNGKQVTGALTHQFPGGLYASAGQSGVATDRCMEGEIRNNKVKFECEMAGPEGRAFMQSFTGVVEGDKLTLTPANKTPFTLNREQ